MLTVTGDTYHCTSYSPIPSHQPCTDRLLWPNIFWHLRNKSHDRHRGDHTQRWWYWCDRRDRRARARWCPGKLPRKCRVSWGCWRWRWQGLSWVLYWPGIDNYILFSSISWSTYLHIEVLSLFLVYLLRLLRQLRLIMIDHGQPLSLYTDPKKWIQQHHGRMVRWSAFWWRSYSLWWWGRKNSETPPRCNLRTRNNMATTISTNLDKLWCFLNEGLKFVKHDRLQQFRVYLIEYSKFGITLVEWGDYLNRTLLPPFPTYHN